MGKRAYYLIFLLFALAADFATKKWAVHSLMPISSPLYPFGGVAVFSLGSFSLSLNLVYNTGAAFGLLTGHAFFLFSLRLFACIALGWTLLKNGRLSFALYLILAGALGNTIDYFLYGQVVDFIHLRFASSSFPLFNLADSCITCGAFFAFFIKSPHAPKIVS